MKMNFEEFKVTVKQHSVYKKHQPSDILESWRYY